MKKGENFSYIGVVDVSIINKRTWGPSTIVMDVTVVQNGTINTILLINFMYLSALIS